MPIYEYRCGKCEVEFEKLVFGKDEVMCPNCGGQVQKMMSSCSFKSAAGDFKTSGMENPDAVPVQPPHAQRAINKNCKPFSFGKEVLKWCHLVKVLTYDYNSK